MQTVGIRELKNRLTYYLSLTKKGDRIVVTERGTPIAVIHNLDEVQEKASREERLAALSIQRKIRLPVKDSRWKTAKPIKIRGESLSDTVVKDRR